YPAYIELQLTATDANGASATTSVNLQPRTVDLTFLSDPPGLQLTAGSTTGATPFTGTVIVGSAIGVAAPTPQDMGSTRFVLSSWSDGGAAAHTITAPAPTSSYTASYAQDHPPTARIQATPTSGPAKLRVTLDGRVSSDPDRGDALAYSWDVNGDGIFGDSARRKLAKVFKKAGDHVV